MTIVSDATLARVAPEQAPPLARALDNLQAAEQRARVAVLSAAKRYALVACFNAGGLNKKSGAWHGTADGKPICGVTVADLARDGLMSLSTENRLGTARLTERGSSCARTLIADAASAEASLEG